MSKIIPTCGKSFGQNWSGWVWLPSLLKMVNRLLRAAIREMMPEIDGWERIRILRATPETKEIPILAATALFRPSDLQACIDAGCNEYIVKPFTFNKSVDSSVRI